MGFLFSKLIRNFVMLYVLFSATNYLLRWKSYSFSPKEFRNLASKVQGSGTGVSASNRIVHDLVRVYGPAIVSDPKWLALHAGGLNLKVQLLHVSLTEYIAIFAAPFDTSGRSGFHWSNSTCTVLSGSVERSVDTINLSNKESFMTGGNFRQGQFESNIYKFAEDTYVICYGRGVVPVSSLWSISGALSLGDPIMVGRYLYVSGEAFLHNTLYSVMTTFDYYKKKALKTEL